MSMDSPWAPVLMDIGALRKDMEREAKQLGKSSYSDGLIDGAFGTPGDLENASMAEAILSLRPKNRSLFAISMLAKVRVSRSDAELKEYLYAVAAFIVNWIEDIDDRSKQPAKLKTTSPPKTGFAYINYMGRAA